MRKTSIFNSFVLPTLVAVLGLSGLTLHAQYSNTPPAGLVAWWPGEGNADDIIGGNNGVLEGGMSFAPGEFGQAFAMIGGTQCVQIPDAPALEPSSFTLSCWFCASNATGSLIQKPLGNVVYDSYGVWFQNGALNATLCNATQHGAILSVGFIPVQGKWYHVAYTFDGDSGIEALYVDGDLEGSGPAGAQVGYDSQPVLIGADIDYGSMDLQFVGEIDEVMLFNRALSANEVISLYTGNPVTNSPPPAPSLNVASVGSQSVLFWAQSATNYILQSTSDLTSSNWVTATDAVPVIAFTVTNTSPARFFRLVSP